MVHRFLKNQHLSVNQEDDFPEVVFFFVSADALAGLHSLANFDAFDSHGVISPFGSGCDSLVGFSMKEMADDTVYLRVHILK